MQYQHYNFMILMMPLCSYKDGTINRIISECSKLAQKEYKARHDRVGKVIHWEMCKKFNLTIRTNGICTTQHMSLRMTHKLLWDFDIHTHHLISARRPDLIIINKKKIFLNQENIQNCELCCPD